MATIQCFRKSSCQMYEKFSAKKLLKFVKAAEPVLKLLRRKQRTNAVTPSTCNYDVVESFQNHANESELYRLDFKFLDDSSEADENMKNEELEKRLLKKLQDDALRSVRGPGWAPRSDVDICKRGDEYVTGRQRAERQAPAATASAAAIIAVA